ncbi:Hypothetical protein FKW44_014779 [Caligus rogercresseyi]|uniref:Uncharacterized protein n=1 Tax=Caligus rogercresseyi TaxID=217165 RepID=A0A7T8GZC7_CALRO|nr:Hypothetical protein FKW44_014779 [Caligus rogercresseyi]
MGLQEIGDPDPLIDYFEHVMKGATTAIGRNCSSEHKIWSPAGRPPVVSFIQLCLGWSIGGGKGPSGSTTRPL